LSEDILCNFFERFGHINMGLAPGWGSGV
jgi:hypothetical protein